MSNTKKKKHKIKPVKSEAKSDVLQRLAQASVEGLAIQVAVNTVMPGAGLALEGLKSVKNIKKAGQVMGKSAAKEGVKMLDDEGRENQTPAEDLSEDIALEMLTRVGGRG